MCLPFHSFRKLVASVLCLTFFLTGCKNTEKKTVKTEEITFTKEGELRIYKPGTDVPVLNLNIELAETEYETQTGLMYRTSMKDNEAMLFIFDDVAMHSFYMKNTQFPLDILFIKEDMTIGNFQENAQPLNEGSLSSKIPVQYVLEVNAGIVAEKGLSIGDSISFQKL